MSSRYLFRGKRVDNGEWVEGDLCQNQLPKVFIFPLDGMDSPDNYEVIPETVGQWTGLTDKNEQNIFDKDKVHCNGVDYLVVWEIGKAPELRGVDNNKFCGFLFNYNNTVEVIHD